MPLCQLERRPAGEYRSDVSHGVQEGDAGADLKGGCVGWIGQHCAVIDPAIDSVEVTGEFADVMGDGFVADVIDPPLDAADQRRQADRGEIWQREVRVL